MAFGVWVTSLGAKMPTCAERTMAHVGVARFIRGAVRVTWSDSGRTWGETPLQNGVGALHGYINQGTRVEDVKICLECIPITARPLI